MDTNCFRNAKIYKLINNVDNEFYVGSTCSSLQRRLSTHKGNAKIHNNRPVYQHLNNIGFENVSIELIENFPCDNKVQLEIREKHWIDTLNPTLNTRKPAKYRTTLKQKIQLTAEVMEALNRIRNQNTASTSNK